MKTYQYWNISGVPAPFFYVEASSILEADKLFFDEFKVHPSKLGHVVERASLGNGYGYKRKYPQTVSRTFFYKDLVDAIDGLSKIS